VESVDEITAALLVGVVERLEGDVTVTGDTVEFSKVVSFFAKSFVILVGVVNELEKLKVFVAGVTTTGALVVSV